MLSMLGKKINRQHYQMFSSYFFQKIGFNISCKNVKFYFSVKISKVSSICPVLNAEFIHSIVSVKGCRYKWVLHDLLFLQDEDTLVSGLISIPLVVQPEILIQRGI